jgi:catechol 2,3-dioxygenase-like lactoylglutathione lyase family enzyme
LGGEAGAVQRAAAILEQPAREPDRKGVGRASSLKPGARHVRARFSTTMIIHGVTLLVRDYDEAIAFFTRTLGFRLIEDTPLSTAKRWVVVGPTSSDGTTVLLARAATAEQRALIGKQAAGRVAFFLHTEDFWRDHAELERRGLKFTEPPREEPYGTVAVFEDLYGNRWDLVQPSRDGGADEVSRREVV